jgi:hypothetical protein
MEACYPQEVLGEEEEAGRLTGGGELVVTSRGGTVHSAGKSENVKV